MNSKKAMDPSKRRFWLCLGLGFYGLFMIPIAVTSLWGAWLMVEHDWLNLENWGQMGLEPSHILGLFLLDKMDISFIQALSWSYRRLFGIPILVFSMISTLRLAQPYWWLEIWIRRVKANGDLLEERLESDTQFSWFEGIVLFFKAISLDTQSGIIRRILKRAHRKYQDTTEESKT